MAAPAPDSMSLAVVQNPYVPSKPTLDALNARTGVVRWRQPIEKGKWVTAATDDQIINLASGFDVTTVRVSDGRRVCRYHSNSNVGFGTPVIANNVLFVPSHVEYPHIITSCPPECEPNEAVIALNAATGAMYWRVVENAWSVVMPITA